MNYLLERPRLLGLLCGCAAVGLGLAYMAVGGAPRSHLLVNSGAMLLGAMMWLAFAKGAATRIIPTGTAVFVLALPLLATAFFGVAADGVSRWISVGPLSIQVSLVVLPMMIVLYALSPDRLGTAGMLIAAFALAAQPDRAMAGVLAAGLAGLVFAKPKRLPATALAAAIFAFAATLLLPDNSPAVPFVDRILYTAFAVHTLAGLAVAAGCALLLLPAFVVAMRSRSHWPIMLAFGASWAAVVAAAALGNYPTPLVGYGGSAVLGYLLSVALLPEVIGKAAYGRPSRDGSTLRREDGALKRRITRLA